LVLLPEVLSKLSKWGVAQKKHRKSPLQFHFWSLLLIITSETLGSRDSPLQSLPWTLRGACTHSDKKKEQTRLEREGGYAFLIPILKKLCQHCAHILLVAGHLTGIISAYSSHSSHSRYSSRL
jgi:hypothetical protein